MLYARLLPDQAECSQNEGIRREQDGNVPSACTGRGDPAV